MGYSSLRFWYFGVFAIGLVLSPLSSYIFQSILHLPFTFPELIYFPALVCVYKKCGIEIKGNIHFMPLSFLWILLIVFGLLNGRWDVVAILSTARAFFWLFFFFSIGRHLVFNESLIDSLLLISIGSTIGWCICSYINLGDIISGANEIGVNYGNMVAIAIAFPILVLYKKKNYLLLFVILLNIFLVLTTGLRRQISITLISLFISYMLLFIKRIDIKKLGILAILCVSIILLLPTIEEQLAEFSPLLHRRIFEKTEMLFEGSAANADETREAGLFIIFDKFEELLIPHGFVSLQTSKDESVGVFIDTPIYMLSYTLSIFVFFVYLFLYIRELLLVLKQYMKKRVIESAYLFVVGVCILFLHFVDGTMFTYSYSSALTGVSMGLLFRNRRYYMEIIH